MSFAYAGQGFTPFYKPALDTSLAGRVQIVMRGFIARLTPYLDPGAGMFLWQILLSISAGLLFRCLRGFSRKPAVTRVKH